MDERMSIMLDSELKKTLLALAKQQNRSLSNLVRLVIEKGIAALNEDSTTQPEKQAA